MKKLLRLLIIVVLSISMIAAFSLAGCKGTEEEATTEEETTEEEATVEEETTEEEVVAEEEAEIGPEVELTVLNYEDITSPEAKVWDKIVAAFNAKYPNITLTVEHSTGEAYHQKLAALAAAGELPDVMILFPGSRSAEIYENKLVEDLYPYLGADKDKFNSFAVEPQWDGKLYELPISITASHMVFVNTKILDDLGLSMPNTYAELVA
ncbi:MAG: extracellular solute-binding protein, partial [Actinomycetota bacterium]|nr:extracellular solute-binding protein [Actinomycetota bacterium]